MRQLRQFDVPEPITGLNESRTVEDPVGRRSLSLGETGGRDDERSYRIGQQAERSVLATAASRAERVAAGRAARERLPRKELLPVSDSFRLQPTSSWAGRMFGS